MSVTVTKTVFDYLFKHLVDIHHRKIRIINSYASDYDVYMRVLDFIKSYIDYVENFLGDVIVAEGDDKLPFVTFDCIVHLSSSNATESLACAVTLPNDETENVELPESIKLIPCCTPDANELILKKCGQSVVLKEDGRGQCYIVKSIETNVGLPKMVI